MSTNGRNGRNEIITVAKILLTNQMVLIVNCDFSSIVFVGCTEISCGY